MHVCARARDVRTTGVSDIAEKCVVCMWVGHVKIHLCGGASKEHSTPKIGASWSKPNRYVRGVNMRPTSATVVFTLLVHLAMVTSERRPIYNIAHMCNSIREVQSFLDRGANAFETDVTFQNNGNVKWAFHGFPCDCLRECNHREDFAQFLEHVRMITSPSTPSYREGLALVFFDLKVSRLPMESKYMAGTEVARHLIKYLWQRGEAESQINVILSIGHTSDSEVVKGVLKTFESEGLYNLTERIGWDVGLNDPLPDIEKLWKDQGITARRWQGDGISNCLSPFMNPVRLRSAIKIRDSDDETRFFEKVYQWTVDFTPNLRTSLSYGVDAIITNYPERLKAILLEEEFRQMFRLATPADSPWEPRHVNKECVVANVQRPMLLEIFSVSGEMMASMGSYMSDVLRFHLVRNSRNIFTQLAIAILGVLLLGSTEFLDQMLP